VPGYYTTEAPNYTIENTAPAYYTEAHKYCSTPSYTTTTEAAKYYVAQTYNKAADPSEINQNKHHTKTPVYYTTTYATPRYYDEAPNYYTEDGIYYTTTYSAPV
jgi:hypothetical protein